MSESSNISSLIENLQKINEDRIAKFTLPVSKLKVELKPLQAKHTTKINSSVMASMSGASKTKLFEEIVEGILKETLKLPDGKTTKDFALFDYIFLLLKMREGMNPILNIENEEDEESIQVDITQKIKEFIKLKKEGSVTLDLKKVGKLTLQVPSYFSTRFYQKQLKQRQKKWEDKKPEQIDTEAVLIDVFAFAVLPYLYELTYIVDNDEQKISFGDLGASEQIQFLENLPSSAHREITEAIGELNKPIDEFRKIEGTELELPLDAMLLIDN